MAEEYNINFALPLALFLFIFIVSLFSHLHFKYLQHKEVMRQYKE